jgi:prepilin-type N-terminal cleavage/methylation domain-containing protein
MVLKKGFTLVELIIVIAIIAMMAVMMTGNLNPAMLVGKANDATRKKDVRRIKVAFEEYYNDKGCYPSGAILDALNNAANCVTGIFSPWLGSWPCDPVKRIPYHIYVDQVAQGGVGVNVDCPRQYSIYTNLENKQDKDIPAGWYGQSATFYMGNGNETPQTANFGVSSPNINWYDKSLSVECGTQLTECYTYVRGVCQALDVNFQHQNAYTVCNQKCMVDCCFQGKPCP